MNQTRRGLFKNIGLVTSSLILSKISNTHAATLIQTPTQTEGPFYPLGDQLDKDNDLTFVYEKTKKAKGQVIYIEGTALDLNNKPIKNAIVEIWQACDSGKYNHPSDPNPARLDPNFQYWGRTMTNAKGRYLFKTIKPGHYPATASWMRPAHIHFKIHKRGYHELTTQMYFKNDRYNSSDKILQALSKKEKNNVIVDFKKNSQNKVTGEFSIYLKKVL
jgi:protocatechuate 3,4-dioxygenase beta subunit